MIANYWSMPSLQEKCEDWIINNTPLSHEDFLLKVMMMSDHSDFLTKECCFWSLNQILLKGNFSDKEDPFVEFLEQNGNQLTALDLS